MLGITLTAGVNDMEEEGYLSMLETGNTAQNPASAVCVSIAAMFIRFIGSSSDFSPTIANFGEEWYLSTLEIGNTAQKMALIATTSLQAEIDVRLWRSKPDDIPSIPAMDGSSNRTTRRWHEPVMTCGDRLCLFCSESVAGNAGSRTPPHADSQLSSSIWCISAPQQ